MIRFIIVDDDEKWQNNIKQVIINTMFNNPEPINIKTFKSYGEPLAKEILDRSQRTIYLIDINLHDSMTGDKIALEIRREDWDSEIIFLTKHDEFFERVYRNICKVFDFIEKNNELTPRLIEDIKSILAVKYDVKMFKYNNKCLYVSIYMKDILYLYRDTSDRKLHIVTKYNHFAIKLSIKKALEKLDERFIQVHRSCIINNEHVNVFHWNNGSFILDNNEEIFLLSKKYKDNVDCKFDIL